MATPGNSSASSSAPSPPSPYDFTPTSSTSSASSSSSADAVSFLPTILDRHIDEPRKLRVAVIGAGLSGITAGILLPAKLPNIELTIYEKNEDFGGTWLENVYPGVRCDVPSHVYQSTFAPNIHWSDKFAPGAEIRDYWQNTARAFGVDRLTVFGRRVEDLEWDAAAAVWRVTLRHVGTDVAETVEADFVIPAIGRFNDWRLPDYPGLADYKGVLRHASHWDDSYDLADKRVAVIGNGASGIQLLANIQPRVGHLDHYARSRTWIAGALIGEARTLAPQPIPQELRDTFTDPAVYLAFRKQLEDPYWRRFRGFYRDSPENESMRVAFTDIMRSRLSKKPELAELLVPDVAPNCRRLTPGPGYLEALTEDNVELIQTPIRRFTATGIETVDGRHRPVDAVFCATGANVDLMPPFPIRASGRDLRQDWAADGKPGFPQTYLGHAVPGYPNLLFLHGPNGSGTSGTLPHGVESQVTFVARVLRKVAYEGIQSIVPSRQATADFTAYAEAFFQRTVLTDACSSWYNGGKIGGRVTAVWPGSATHAGLVRQHPRWEDWDYEYLPASGGNRFAWYFGDGITKRETDPEADITSYLQAGQATEADLRALHERWWE